MGGTDEVTENVMEINELGKKIIKEENKEKTLFIITLILTIAGLATGFIGAIEGLVIHVAIEMAQFIAVWGITGTVRGEDVGFLALGLFGGIFSGVKIGRDAKELANSYRSGLTSDFKNSVKMFKYNKILEDLKINKICKA